MLYIPVNNFSDMHMFSLVELEVSTGSEDKVFCPAGSAT